MPDSFLTRSGWPRSWVRWLLLGLICGVGLFVDLGAPEIGLMEARNFVAAREMHAGGSWLLPTMNGELRLAKPPLPTWLVAAVMHLTGNTRDLALLRVPSAVGACLLVLFFWILARRLTAGYAGSAETAWLAAVVLASSLLFLTVGRDGNGWDVYTYSFAAGALVAGLHGVLSSRAGWGWFAAGGLLLGLSALSKGPVGFYGMVLPFVLAYAWRGDRAAARRHVRGLVLLAGVGLTTAAAWPLYVLQKHAQQASTVAQVESTSWLSRHVKSIWYYADFPVFMGMWALVAAASLVWPYAARRVRPFAPYGLVLAWLGITVLLLELVPEKKERYLLPVLPPLALLVAGLLRHWLSVANARGLTRVDYLLQRLWAGLLLVILFGVPVALWALKLPAFAPSGLRFYLIAALCYTLAGRLLLAWRRGPLTPESVRASVGVVLMACGLLMPIYPEWRRRSDDPGLRPQSGVVGRHPQLRSASVYRLAEMHVKWVWAAGRAVPLWQVPADTAPLKHLPVLVYSGARAPAGFPRAWQERFRITTLDSFHLSHQIGDGTWYVLRVSAK